eukprot:Nk52_evm12s2596 gene=Nk52_evmTU12s2596
MVEDSENQMPTDGLDEFSFLQFLACAHCGKSLKNYAGATQERPGKELFPCLGCATMLYCSRKCKEEGWEHHQSDCEVILSVSCSNSAYSYLSRISESWKDENTKCMDIRNEFMLSVCEIAKQLAFSDMELLYTNGRNNSKCQEARRTVIYKTNVAYLKSACILQKKEEAKEGNQKEKFKLLAKGDVISKQILDIVFSLCLLTKRTYEQPNGEFHQIETFPFFPGNKSIWKEQNVFILLNMKTLFISKMITVGNMIKLLRKGGCYPNEGEEWEVRESTPVSAQALYATEIGSTIDEIEIDAKCSSLVGDDVFRVLKRISMGLPVADGVKFIGRNGDTLFDFEVFLIRESMKYYKSLSDCEFMAGISEKVEGCLIRLQGLWSTHSKEREKQKAFSDDELTRLEQKVTLAIISLGVCNVTSSFGDCEEFNYFVLFRECSMAFLSLVDVMGRTGMGGKKEEYCLLAWRMAWIFCGLGKPIGFLDAKKKDAGNLSLPHWHMYPPYSRIHPQFIEIEEEAKLDVPFFFEECRSYLDYFLAVMYWKLYLPKGGYRGYFLLAKDERKEFLLRIFGKVEALERLFISDCKTFLSGTNRKCGSGDIVHPNDVCSWCSAHCLVEDMQGCGGCNDAIYCSTACKKDHFICGKHSTVCQKSCLTASKRAIVKPKLHENISSLTHKRKFDALIGDIVPKSQVSLAQKFEVDLSFVELEDEDSEEAIGQKIWAKFSSESLAEVLTQTFNAYAECNMFALFKPDSLEKAYRGNILDTMSSLCRFIRSDTQVTVVSYGSFDNDPFERIIGKKVQYVCPDVVLKSEPIVQSLIEAKIGFQPSIERSCKFFASAQMNDKPVYGAGVFAVMGLKHTAEGRQSGNIGFEHYLSTKFDIPLLIEAMYFALVYLLAKMRLQLKTPSTDENAAAKPIYTVEKALSVMSFVQYIFSRSKSLKEKLDSTFMRDRYYLFFKKLKRECIYLLAAERVARKMSSSLSNSANQSIELSDEHIRSYIKETFFTDFGLSESQCMHPGAPCDEMILGISKDKDISPCGCDMCIDFAKILNCCFNCGKRDVKLVLCIQCKLAKYCNRDCQRSHWRAFHKRSCKVLKSGFDKQEPSDVDKSQSDSYMQCALSKFVNPNDFRATVEGKKVFGGFGPASYSIPIEFHSYFDELILDIILSRHMRPRQNRTSNGRYREVSADNNLFWHECFDLKQEDIAASRATLKGGLFVVEDDVFLRMLRKCVIASAVNLKYGIELILQLIHSIIVSMRIEKNEHARGMLCCASYVRWTLLDRSGHFIHSNDVQGMRDTIVSTLDSKSIASLPSSYKETLRYLFPSGLKISHSIDSSSSFELYISKAWKTMDSCGRLEAASRPFAVVEALTTTKAGYRTLDNVAKEMDIRLRKFLSDIGFRGNQTYHAAIGDIMLNMIRLEMEQGYSGERQRLGESLKDILMRVNECGPLPFDVEQSSIEDDNGILSSSDTGLSCIEVPQYFRYLAQHTEERHKAKEYSRKYLNIATRASSIKECDIIDKHVNYLMVRGDLMEVYVFLLAKLDICICSGNEEAFTGLKLTSVEEIRAYLDSTQERHEIVSKLIAKALQQVTNTSNTSNLEILRQAESFVIEVLLESEYILKSEILSSIDNGSSREDYFIFFAHSFLEAFSFGCQLHFKKNALQWESPLEFAELYRSTFVGKTQIGIFKDDILLDVLSLTSTRVTSSHKRSQLRSISKRCRIYEWHRDIEFVRAEPLVSLSRTVLCWTCQKETSRRRCTRCPRCAGATFCNTECLTANGDGHPSQCPPFIEVDNFSLAVKPHVKFFQDSEDEMHPLNRRLKRATTFSLNALVSNMGHSALEVIFISQKTCSPLFIKVRSLIGKADPILHLQEFMWRVEMEAEKFLPQYHVLQNFVYQSKETDAQSLRYCGRDQDYQDSKTVWKTACCGGNTLAESTVIHRLALYESLMCFIRRHWLIVTSRNANPPVVEGGIVTILHCCEFIQSSVKMGLFRNGDGSFPNIQTSNVLKETVKHKHMALKRLESAINALTRYTVSCEELSDTIMEVSYDTTQWSDEVLEDEANYTLSEWNDSSIANEHSQNTNMLAQMSINGPLNGPNDNTNRNQVESSSTSAGSGDRPNVANEWIPTENLQISSRASRATPPPARKKRPALLGEASEKKKVAEKECQVISCRDIRESKILCFGNEASKMDQKQKVPLGKTNNHTGRGDQATSEIDLYDENFDASSLVVPDKPDDIPEIPPHCPSCFIDWNVFEKTIVAVILPCGHAICALCLIKLKQSSQDVNVYIYKEPNPEGPGIIDVEAQYRISFRCPECRERAPNYALGQLFEYYLDVFLIKQQRLLAKKKIFPSSDGIRSFLMDLLQDHEFNVHKVSDMVLEYLAAFDYSNSRDLSHEEKQQIYAEAQAPINALKRDKAKLERNIDEMEKKGKTLTRRYERSLEELVRVSDRLQGLYDNAYDDIFERINSQSATMGVMGGKGSDGEGELCIDLHGLSVKQGLRKLDELVLPIIGLVKRVLVVTGRGLHSDIMGRSVLKENVEEYARSNGLRASAVKNNPGAIRLSILGK